MGLETITNKIKKSCSNDEIMKNMLMEIFKLQLEQPGHWKPKYRAIIEKNAKESLDSDENS